MIPPRVSATLLALSLVAALSAVVGLVLHILGRVDICPYAFGTAVAAMAMVFLVAIYQLVRAGMLQRQ